jgi:hypothetical protein
LHVLTAASILLPGNSANKLACRIALHRIVDLW